MGIWGWGGVGGGGWMCEVVLHLGRGEVWRGVEVWVGWIMRGGGLWCEDVERGSPLVWKGAGPSRG